MKGTRVALPIAFLSLALVVLVFAGTNFVAAPFWLVFRRAAGLESAKTVAQIAAALTTACLFVVGALVAIPTALEPAAWFRKALHVLPVYLVGLTAAAVAANLAGFFTLGSVLDMQSPIRLSLATMWLGASGALGTVLIAIALARANLGRRILRAVWVTMGIALVPGVILSLAMIGSINIVLSNQSAPAPAGGPPAPAIVPNAAGALAGLVSQVEVGAGLMTALAVLALVSFGLGLRARRGASAAAAAEALPSARIDYKREVLRALAGCVGISVVAFAAMQLVPVSRENPPAQGTVQWDTPQTAALVTRACTNCHGNDTVWPWYATFAPGSWITSVHVNSARQQWNVADLSTMPSTRKRRLVSNMVDQIRNGVMPPIDYQFLHPEARLSADEKEQLIQGLQDSLK